MLDTWQQWQNAIDEIIANKSATTGRAYRRAWHDWLDHLDGRQPWQATRQDVREFAKRLRTRGLLRSSVAQKINTCGAIWHALQAAGLAAETAEPLFTLAGLNLSTDLQHRRYARPLQQEQIEALLALPQNTLTDKRDGSLLALLLATGAKPTEVLQMRVKDLLAPETADAPAQIKFADRVVPIPEHVYRNVIDYLATVPWAALPDSYLWRPVHRGNHYGHNTSSLTPITPQRINDILRRRLYQAGCHDAHLYTALSLRSTFAAQWQTDDLAEVQRRLGLKKPNNVCKWLYK